MPEVNTERPIDTGLRGLIDGGAPIADAIRIALWRWLVDQGMTTDRNSKGAIPDFAAEHRLDPKNFAATIYSGRSPTSEMLDALCGALGGTPDEWRELLWRAQAPITAAAS